MKTIIFVLFGLCCVLLQQANAAAITTQNFETKWQDFKIKFDKVYASDEEETVRKTIFRENLSIIEAHNKKYNKGEVTWTMGINKFTDMTKDEINGMLGFKNFAVDFDKEWEEYKAKFEKVYKSEEENKFRMEIFRKNLIIIEAHNEKYENGEITWSMGVNKFTDMTPEEIKKYLGFNGAPNMSNEQWEDYKKQFGKVYKSEEEDNMRMKLFLDNLAIIEAHNEKYQKGEVTWEMGVNKFTDMTPEEMKKYLGFRGASTQYDTEWENFKKEFNRHYKSSEEEQMRKEIFSKNLEIIKEHNAKYERHEVSWTMGINEFTDLTPEEFKQRLGLKRNPKFALKSRSAPIDIKPVSVNLTEEFSTVELPKEVDWVKYGFKTRIMNQGTCGSCYAMGVVGAIESHWYIKNKEFIELSQQELVDCTLTYGNMGCQYGDLNNSFKYVLENGLGTFEKNPYLERVAECKKTEPRYHIKGWSQTKAEDEEDLKRAVAKGPVIAVISSGLFDFQHYTDGVYYNKDCIIDPYSVNHFVLVMGYGTTEQGEDYWLIKNTWGSFWGMEGYGLMARNRGNLCGIATEAMYPIL